MSKYWKSFNWRTLNYLWVIPVMTSSMILFLVLTFVTMGAFKGMIAWCDLCEWADRMVGER